MNKQILTVISVIIVVLFTSMYLPVPDADARAGRGGSFGSRGTRSYSPPSRPSSNTAPTRQQAAPSPVQPSPVQQPAGGGFMRGLGGGLLGGLLGGMLFSSLGFGALGNGFGGSGIGMFEILLIGAAGYLLFRVVKGKRKEENLSSRNNQQGAYQTETLPASESSRQEYQNDTSAGLSYIRQMDPGFDEARFKDTAMDIFFKVQGAWMNRNLSPVKSLLTEEMRNILQRDVDALLSDKKVNRLENIAVRNTDLAEAWQESGQDFITVLFRANLLDYTTDDSTGKIIEGSTTDPVKFEEYWTFTRNAGNSPWQLSAISQA